MKTIYYLTLLSLLLSSCTKIQHTSYPTIGDPLPVFNIKMNDGSQLSSSELQDMTCMLVFFHTECPDCQRELPIINEFVNSNPNIAVYAVSREQNKEEVSAYWKENNYSIIYSAQNDRYIYNLFSDRGIPYTIISNKGKITHIYTDKDTLTVALLKQCLCIQTR